jgi:integrase
MTTAAPLDLELLRLEVDKLRGAEMAALTEYGYSRDFHNFCVWCEQASRTSLPATSETLSLFVAHQLGQKKVTTVSRRVAAVSYVHVRAGHPSPADASVRQILRGARRLRCEQLRQMRPLSVEQLRQVAARLTGNGTPIAIRNSAIVLTGFSSALRRSNLSMLLMEDVTFCDEGFVILVRREKNDRRRVGRLVPVPYGTNEFTCPVRALKAWLAVRGMQNGPLFTRQNNNRRSDVEPLSCNSIGTIVKAAIDDIGVEGLWGPHSLRAGLITECGIAGVSPLVIAAQSGHKSLDSLRDYFRPVGLFKACAASMIGL